mgnify:CR=1 FL=1
MITLSDVENNEQVKALIKYSKIQLDNLGYTDHSVRHCKLVAIRTGEILEGLKYSNDIVRLGQIAGYIHDIGNAINRVDHAHSGAILAYSILDKMGMKPEDIAEVIMAIGNHDEATGTPVSPITAALILADKTDVHKSRVNAKGDPNLHIHNRVNYAVQKSYLFVDYENRKISVNLQIDTSVTQIMDYFEIFMQRMILCRKAAEKLGLQFKLIINEQQLI